MQPLLPPVDDTPVWDAWMASYHLPAISAALELNIFEQLVEAPHSSPALAAALGYEPRALKALLGLLTSLGLLCRHGGEYSLSEVSKHYLLRASPLYWGAVFERMSASLNSHKLLVETLRGQRGASGVSRPSDAWERGEMDPEQAREITAFMHSHSAAAALGLSRNAIFGDCSRLLDVGGGSGCFSLALARAFPELRCTVLDLPPICRLAQGYIAEAGLEARVDTLALDMFRQDWPRAYDALFFSNIFHDWSPETCAALARSAWQALPAGGRIFLHEMLLDDGGATPQAALSFSLLMALSARGQQFTFAELRDLLAEAGFVEIRCEPAYGYYSLLVGCKPR